MLSRLIYGARISLLIGFGSQILSLVLGIVFGLLAGFFGGVTDTIISRLIEILQAFPSLLFIIVLSVSIGPGAAHRLHRARHRRLGRGVARASCAARR